MNNEMALVGLLFGAVFATSFAWVGSRNGELETALILT
jgi:hypothetical protein